MFYDDEPESIPWDYFLAQYKRDLLALTLEEIVRKNPDKTPNELTAEVEQMMARQDAFKEKP